MTGPGCVAGASALTTAAVPGGDLRALNGAKACIADAPPAAVFAGRGRGGVDGGGGACGVQQPNTSEGLARGGGPGLPLAAGSGCDASRCEPMAWGNGTEASGNRTEGVMA